jgi:hypothetical protein
LGSSSSRYNLKSFAVSKLELSLLAFSLSFIS